MAKFLFVSYEGLIADTAWQVTKEDHEAKLWILSSGEQDIADGFVAKVKDWRKEVDWADVVVFDDVLGGMGAMADEMRVQGKPVVGGPPYTDRLTKRSPTSRPIRTATSSSRAAKRRTTSVSFSSAKRRTGAT